MDSGSKSVNQSKAFPRRERMNCFVSKSPSVPALLQVSTKWATCCLGFPFLLNCWNFGGWKPGGIRKLSILLVYSFEYIRKLWGALPYWARIVFVIMSCNYWTDKEAMEVEFVCWSSTLLWPSWGVRWWIGPLLDSPWLGSCLSLGSQSKYL